MAGEDSYHAALREVKEETGLDVSGAKHRFAFDYHRENPGEGDNYFVDIYLFEMEFTKEMIRLQESEATDFAIADLEKIRSLAGEGIFLHYESIKEVFSMKI